MSNLDKAVDFLRDHAGDFAIAEAQLVYMTLM